MARVVGIDVGTSRIGVAISDESALFAQPHAVISAAGGMDQAICEILDLCREHDIGTVVVGMPLSKDGNESGESARRARLVGSRIENALGAKVEYWDERFSSVETERLLISAGVNRKGRRKVADKVAASIILQGYLDAKNRKE